MTYEDVRAVAEMMIGRHGRGASLLVYEQVTRTMRSSNRSAAEQWCRVLIEIEAALNRA